MSKYIDADNLIAEFQKEQMQMVRHGRKFASSFMANGEISTEWHCVEDIVENMPEAIVRCKDCKFHTEDDECVNPHWDCKESEVYPTAYEYDFCSYGERK